MGTRTAVREQDRFVEHRREALLHRAIMPAAGCPTPDRDGGDHPLPGVHLGVDLVDRRPRRSPPRLRRVFNFSGSEFIFLLILALVILGPDRLPDAIRKFGKTYGEFKKMSTGFQTELKQALDEPMREMRSTAEELKKAATFDVDLPGVTKPKSAGGPGSVPQQPGPPNEQTPSATSAPSTPSAPTAAQIAASAAVPASFSATPASDAAGPSAAPLDPSVAASLVDEFGAVRRAPGANGTDGSVPEVGDSIGQPPAWVRETMDRTARGPVPIDVAAVGEPAAPRAVAPNEPPLAPAATATPSPPMTADGARDDHAADDRAADDRAADDRAADDRADADTVGEDVS
jgi:sec-independent protein translocase protein TatB